MKTTTTDQAMTAFEKEKLGLIEFSWGRIVATYEIAEYGIIEAVNESVRHQGEVRFYPYVKGRPLPHSYNSLDEALVGAIAFKRDGLNSRAARYFLKATDNGGPHEDYIDF